MTTGSHNGAVHHTPPQNLQAEQAVLGAVLLNAQVLGRVAAIVGADDFASPRHRAIWEAAVSVHARGGAADPITVEAELQRQELLKDVGGIAYLIQLGDHVATTANVEHYAGIVREKAVAREAMRAGQLLAGAAAESLDAPEAIAAARSRLDILARRLKGTPETVVLRPFERAWLYDYPPARRWLLRRPTRSGRPCPAWEGDGLLPLGKVALLVADGGVGKTMAIIALAISIATGRPWLGYYHVGEDAQGKVLLILAEEDDEEVHRRLFGVAAALELSDHERDLVAQRLVVLPTDGLTLSLADNAGDPTPDLLALRAALDASGPWAMVAADPFGQLVGLEAETDNAIATRTLRSLRALTTVRGTPTLLLAHHSSLDGINQGRARARGVTGIRNAARWEATLRPEEKGKAVLFRQTKSNYSIPMPEELRLVRDEGSGLLRAESEEEGQEREASRAAARDDAGSEKTAQRESKLARMEAELLDRLAQLPQLPSSKLQIQALAKGQRQDRVDVVDRLMATKRILNPLAKGLPYRLASLEGTQIELPATQPEPRQP